MWGRGWTGELPEGRRIADGEWARPCLLDVLRAQVIGASFLIGKTFALVPVFLLAYIGAEERG